MQVILVNITKKQASGGGKKAQKMSGWSFATASLMLILLCPFVIEAQCPSSCQHHRVEVGPEIYYMKRTKEGGTEQTGTLYGVSLIYERMRHFGLYWGAEGRCAWGDLKGHNSGGTTLKSHKRDSDIQGSVGFNYRIARWGRCLSLTPIVGGGYFVGKNSFVSPSPLELTYRTHFTYFMYGILATLQWNDATSIGIRFKTKMMFEGKCDVSNDPDSDELSLLMNNENQYEIEIPFQTTYPIYGRVTRFVFTPFYRYRHYGSRENYPYDFIDTQFNIYGARGGWEIAF